MKRKYIIVLLCFVFLAACGHRKPPLAPTQTVNGKSIIVPPEFDIIPQEKAQE